MISHAKFMGGAYDPTATATFQEDGRVILIPSGYGSTLDLPLGYAQFVVDADDTSIPKRHIGGPAFYVVNNKAGALTVKSSGSGTTLFTVAAGSVALVCAGLTEYKVVTERLINTGQTFGVAAGRSVVVAPTAESISTSNLCGDRTFLLTPCTTGSAIYQNDSELWEDKIGQAVEISSLWYRVSEISTLPEGASYTDLGTTVTGILLSGCPTCVALGPGEQFNGHLGLTAPIREWTRLKPIGVGLSPTWVSHKNCYELWIYEGVTHNGVEYDLSSASVITALRTPGGSTAAAMLAGTKRSAYIPLYTTWDYDSKLGASGTPGPALTGYPYVWEGVGSAGGSISGHTIDPGNPSHTFDTAQLTLIYDTMIADHDGSPDIAPAAGFDHTLILYLRLHSERPYNKSISAGVWDSSSFRMGWESDHVYALDDEIRPGCTGVTTDQQFPTSPFAFRCTARSGTFKSAVSPEPTWAGPLGNTIVDNDITWTAVSRNKLQDQSIYLLAAHVTCDP